MKESLAIIIFLLIGLLTFMLIMQKKKLKEQEHKLKSLENHQDNIKFISDTIQNAQDMPISEYTLRLLMGRKAFSLKGILTLFPNRRIYSDQLEVVEREIAEYEVSSSKKGLPKPINETHMISMIKTLKRIKIILGLEMARLHTQRVSIQKEIYKINFMLLYLSANNLMSLALLAKEHGSVGTARERYEAALELLTKSEKKTGLKWINHKIEFCKEQLLVISDEMKESITQGLSTNKVTRDDTGLSRMFDNKKRRIEVN
jgi:hypothetical protein